MEATWKKKGEKAEEEEEEFKKKGDISVNRDRDGVEGGEGGWRFDLRERDCPCSWLVCVQFFFFTKESCQRAKLSIQSFAIHSE